MNQKAVIFDLGGVLVDWNPRYLFRKLFQGDTERMEWFLREVCSHEWNEQQDGGRTWAEGVDLLVKHHPDLEPMIRAYHERWEETLGGDIPETVALLRELHGAGVPLYALTNWSAETFPFAQKRFDWLRLFRHIVVSGEVRLLKPDPRIYHHLLDRCELRAEDCFFTDDVERNVLGARAAGLNSMQFLGVEKLRADLNNWLNRQ